MSFGSALVAIVAILAFTAIRIARYHANGGSDHPEHWREHHRALRRGRGPALPSPREEELTREVEELHQRIAVLERIATDANSSSSARVQAISDEIEALRDR